jgi:hypothetical protein
LPLLLVSLEMACKRVAVVAERWCTICLLFVCCSLVAWPCRNGGLCVRFSLHSPRTHIMDIHSSHHMCLATINSTCEACRPQSAAMFDCSHLDAAPAGLLRTIPPPAVRSTYVLALGWATATSMTVTSPLGRRCASSVAQRPCRRSRGGGRRARGMRAGLQKHGVKD